MMMMMTMIYSICGLVTSLYIIQTSWFYGVLWNSISDLDIGQTFDRNLKSDVLNVFPNHVANQWQPPRYENEYKATKTNILLSSS